MPAELRKRFQKQEGGRWTIVGKHIAPSGPKPSATRQSGRKGGRKTQIAAVSAPEVTIVESMCGAIGVRGGHCCRDI